VVVEELCGFEWASVAGAPEGPVDLVGVWLGAVVVELVGDAVHEPECRFVAQVCGCSAFDQAAGGEPLCDRAGVLERTAAGDDGAGCVDIGAGPRCR
jgi:hypothetical protein